MDISFQHCLLKAWYNTDIWAWKSVHTPAMSTERAGSDFLCAYRENIKGKTCANLEDPFSLSVTAGLYRPSPLSCCLYIPTKWKWKMSIFFHLPAHRFWSWPSSRGIALLEDVVTQQRLSSRLAEWTHHFQFSPGSVHKQLLGLLWVSIGGVVENKSILRQDSTTHLTSVCAAVACITLVQLAVKDKSIHTQ